MPSFPIFIHTHLFFFKNLFALFLFIKQKKLSLLSIKKMKKPSFVFLLGAIIIILCASLVSSEMDLGIDDYGVVNPSPNTQASIKHGPTEHGSPLNPYIPKPPPPPSSPSSSSSSSSSYSYFTYFSPPPQPEEGAQPEEGG